MSNGSNDSWAKGWTIDQLIVGALPGDAITGEAFILQQWLREAGATSRIYAESMDQRLRGRVEPLTAFRPTGGPRRRVIFHYSIGSSVSAVARALPPPVVMIYHNITPAQYFRGADAAVIRATEQGRRELGSFPNIALALADSEFNRQELVAAGYAHTAVLPIPHTPGPPPDPATLARLRDGRTNVLFVGKLAPHKRQDQIIHAFAAFRRADPTARLALVGAPFTPRYARWLGQIAARHGLAAADVLLPGRVSDAELSAYYAAAHAFLCLSDHEGFCVPLVEAMAAGAPVVAYPAAAVPDTLGRAGILVRDKQYPVIAEALYQVTHNPVVRAQVIATGKARANDFRPEVVREQFRAHLAPLCDGR
ncbi:MAG: glycosyltransferase [Dehalococcoidia bacterium]|nr:glycosyltransferase [Dehalococcoidia bacterium]